jgi:cytochrome c-type biogenesis protein
MTDTQTPALALTQFPSRRYRTFLHALLFTFGFSLIFVVGWGGATTLLGRLFSQFKPLISRAGGLLVIVFGLSTLGVLKIPYFYYDTRPAWQANRRAGKLASFMMGVVFAAGWTPCIGATLGAILTMGFSQESSGMAMLLASGYALGLAAPFLMIGLALDRAIRVVRSIRPYLRFIQIFSGLFLILIGLMLATNRLVLIAIWAQQNGFFLDLPLGGAVTPTFFIAILSGLLSFLSPCVLPLVPAYVGYLSGNAFGDSAIWPTPNGG